MAKQTPAIKHSVLMYGAVFVGGAAGSLLREAFSVDIPGIPLVTATFGINVVACFILGWLYAIRNRVHAHVLHLGAVGFCGGLSTFSSFVLELEKIATVVGLGVTVAISTEIVAGLAAALLGEAIGRRYHAERRQR